MKRYILPLLALLASAPAFAASYNLDPAHTKVGFAISHLVISTVEGRFNRFNGTIDMGDKLENMQVSAEINTDSVDTGIADRDKHLRSPDFFDVEKYPTISFKSKKVGGTKEKLKIAGELTIHGVTKPVTLEGKYLGSVKDMQQVERVAFEASTKIKRKDYGLVWNKLVEAGPAVGDDVKISLLVEATKAK